MSILIAFLALLIVVAVAALIYKYNIFNRRELPLMVVIVATLAYFLLAIIAVIAGELAGSNVVIPGIGALTTIVAFFFVLAIVVIAHELGHFATAKACGVRVDEFGIGFPPRIIALKYGETEYSLNWVPLGGFTKMAGEEDPNIERSLASKSIGKRPWCSRRFNYEPSCRFTFNDGFYDFTICYATSASKLLPLTANVLFNRR